MKPFRVLVTRAPHQASALAEELRALGAEPLLLPTIELAPPLSWQPLDEACAKLGHFDWLLFTSANAVEAFANRCLARQSEHVRRALGTVRVAAIGPATRKALEAAGVRTDLVPAQAVAESFADALRPFAKPGVRFLLLRAEVARDHLPDALRSVGASVTIAPAYRTVTPEGSVQGLRDLLANDPPDAVTFTSSSTAHNLLDLLAASDVELPASCVRASIGPITSRTLCERGFPPHVESPEATAAALARSLLKYLQQR